MVRRTRTGFCEAAHTGRKWGYRSAGAGIGAAACAAQDAQGGEPGATCGQVGQNEGADFEQDEQPD